MEQRSKEMINKLLKWEPAIYKRGYLKKISTQQDSVEIIFNRYFTNDLIQESNSTDIYLTCLKDDGSLVFSSEKANLNTNNDLVINLPFSLFDHFSHYNETLSLFVNTPKKSYKIKIDENLSLPVIYNPISESYIEFIRSNSSFLQIKKINSTSSVSINKILFEKETIHFDLTLFIPRIYQKVINNQDEYFIQVNFISNQKTKALNINIDQLALNPNFTASCSINIDIASVGISNTISFYLKRINSEESYQLTIIPKGETLKKKQALLINDEVIFISTELKNDYEFLVKNFKKTFEPRVHSIAKESNDSFKVIIKLHGNVKKYSDDLFNNVKVIFKERDTKAILWYDATYSSHNQTIETIINTNSTLRNNFFTTGIWDAYLKIGESGHLIANPRVHGIKDYSSYNYPQVVINNGNDHYSLKLYYNFAGYLSLFIRDYMIYKNIVSIIYRDNHLFINGHVNIMKPNTDINSDFEGTVKIPIPYSQPLFIKANIRLDKTQRNDIEFSFKIVTNKISPDVMKKVVSSKSFNNWIISLSNRDKNYQFPIIIDKDIDIQFREKSLIRKNIEKILKKGDIFKISFYRLISRILPVKKDTFVFQSFYGNNYSDNPRAIYEKLYDLEGNKNTYVWVLKDKQLFTGKKGIVVKPKSWKYFYFMARSQFFVNNANFPDFFNKRKGQFFLQTWHGTPLKRLGLDVSKNAEAYSANSDKKLIERTRKWDCLITPNAYTSEIMKRAYQLDMPVKVTGYPRNDQLVKPNEEKIKDLRKYFNIPVNKKIILYAPTWREDDDKKESYRLKFNLHKFYKELSEDYVILLRLHYFDARRLQLKNYPDFIYNATYYNDIGDLYNLCDILVTDYSSVMFDFTITNKPVLFYTYDYLKYKDKLRGFYLDFKSVAPGPLLNSSDELLHTIKNIDHVKDKYSEKYSNFKSTFNSYEDGNASQKSLDILFRFREGGKVE